jgi:hypothetical protein
MLISKNTCHPERSVLQRSRRFSVEKQEQKQELS